MIRFPQEEEEAHDERSGCEAKKQQQFRIVLQKGLTPYHRHPYEFVPTVMYVPRLGDIVVGVVTTKFSEGYRVDIHTTREGHLPTTAFANATRLHNPMLDIGSIVLCGIVSVHKDFELGLTCLAAEDSKGWSTKETYLGELSNGMYFDVPSFYSEILLGYNNSLLALIEEKVACEVAVGRNGRVWVTAKTPQIILSVIRAIKEGLQAATLTDLETAVCCHLSSKSLLITIDE